MLGDLDACPGDMAGVIAGRRSLRWRRASREPGGVSGLGCGRLRPEGSPSWLPPLLRPDRGAVAGVAADVGWPGCRQRGSGYRWRDGGQAGPAAWPVCLL